MQTTGCSRPTASSAIESTCRSLRQTPSTTARAIAARPWRADSPSRAPATSARQTGARSPARYGTNDGGSSPAGAASAASASASSTPTPSTPAIHSTDDPPEVVGP